MKETRGNGKRSVERPPLVVQASGDGPSMAPPGHLADHLVAGLRCGDGEAYQRLYGLTSDRLFRAAFRLLGDRQEAEDAVQQAFLELVRAGCPPENGRSLEAWLFTSVRFTCADQFRRRVRRPSTPRAEVPDSEQVDDYWLGYDPGLEAALDELTPTQRLVVHLKHVEGLDGHQIAEIVGSNRIAVYAIAARAERRLRRLLGTGLGGDDG